MDAERTKDAEATSTAASGALLRWFAALLPPFVALGAQWALWSLIDPYAWFLFYPAIFLSSWIGGLRAGLIATLLGTGLVLWFFVPPTHSFLKEPLQYFPPFTFIGIGFLFAGVHERLRTAHHGASAALTETREALDSRRRIERELRETRAHLERAQRVAGIGSWQLDVSANELVWSEETHRIFGIPAGTPMTYEAFLASVHPDDRGYVDREWKAALAGEPYDIEHRIVVGGEVKWVNERADLRRDEQGRVVGGTGTVQDITEHKRAEQALRGAQQQALEAAARLQALHDASAAISDAVTGLPSSSVAAVLRTIAMQARTLTGAQYAVIGIGTDPQRPFDPWVQVGVPAEIARHLGRPPRPVGTLGVVARDGRAVRVREVRDRPEFRGFPPGHPVMTSFLGVPIRFRGASAGNLYLANKQGAEEFSAEDQITVEMLAARASAVLEVARLYQAEGAEREWLQAIVDHLPEGVLILDAEGRVTVMNRGLCALADTAAGGGGVPLALHLPSGAAVPAEELPYVRARREGTACSGLEYQIRRRDGRVVPVLVSAAPVQLPVGKRTGVAAIVQDVSALKELERLREEWTSLVAHDLRQPLNRISMAAGLLEGAPYSEETRAKAAALLRSGVRTLDRMIADLLDASRIESRRMTVERREVSLPVVVRGLLAQLPEALAARCDLEVGRGTDQKTWADRGRIEQVLSNLLSNAAKYGDPGSRIQVRLIARAHETEICVTNRGAGIRSDELPRLFQRFTRTEAARAGRTAGTGLGLYISRGLVEAHGGRMWAESTPEETTTFHFTIPVGLRREEEIAPPGHGPG